MSFSIFTDGCSNLPGYLLQNLDIQVLPCSYMVDSQTVPYSGDIDHFDAKAYYDLIRSGKTISTTLLNSQTFLDHFRPALEAGSDIVYVGISSGISGTFQAASIAVAELAEQFPDRVIRTVDSRGAGFGVGLLACLAADLRNQGLTADAAAEQLNEATDHLCEYFTVGELKYLHRTGRINAATATIGTMLNIKPLLRGDEEGHIVSCGKYRGRKKAIDAIVEKYKTKAVDPEHNRVAITHGDCLEEAQDLAERIRAIAEPKELILCPHEPFTGAHVGPGMLSLFFFGDGR